MGVAVVTVAAGGLPVIDVTATKPALGVPVTEAVNGRGIPVTKVSLAIGGLPVTFVATGNEWPAGGGGTTYATLDDTPTAGIVMSNGNLTAVHGSTNTACGVRSTALKTTGKYYFEVTLQVWATALSRIGIILSTGTYAQTAGSNNVVAICGTGSTNIAANGVTTGYAIGVTAAGNVFGMAVDLTARLMWFRRQGGLWNGDASADPATGVNGVSIAAGSWSPLVHFGTATSASATDQMTANFGASGFVGAVPSGFTSGWPA